MLPMIFGENLFDDLFNDAFERSMWNTDKALYGKRASQLMKTDVHETEEGYELNVDLPGFSKDEINVELKNGYLTIKDYDMEFNTFLLDFPNNEVKNGFLTAVASSYLKPSEETGCCLCRSKSRVY